MTSRTNCRESKGHVAEIKERKLNDDLNMAPLK